MSIFKFVSQDELESLPEDPQQAFATFVNHAQRRFAEILAGFNPDEQNEWHQIEETRHSFMNIVLAAAKRFEIEPFLSMEVPLWSEFDNKHHREFQADLDHYLTQLVIDNSLRAKRDSVTILPKSKDRIRAHVQGLRDCVDNANMTDAKREALIKKLDDFEKELEKQRLNLFVTARIAFELLAIPGGVWASAEIANKLIHNVMQTVAEAKAAEDETRQLPPTATPKALSPPRQTPPPAFASDDLDDDVPF